MTTANKEQWEDQCRIKKAKVVHNKVYQLQHIDARL